MFSSDLYGKRERPSVNAALQWAPNSSSVYTAEVYYSGYRGDTFNSLQFSFVDFWANPQAPMLYNGTNIVKSRVATASMASTAPIIRAARPTASSTR